MGAPVLTGEPWEGGPGRRRPVSVHLAHLLRLCARFPHALEEAPLFLITSRSADFIVSMW